MLAHYGNFRNVKNYIVLAGKQDEGFDFRCGYYGEKMVLFAQQKFAFGIKNGEPAVKVKGSGVHTKVDLGIVAYHFEVGSGRKISVL